MSPKDQRNCFYCGIEFGVDQLRKSRDHIIPRSRGGTNAPDNIVFACQRCNGDKGALTLEEYRSVISLRFGHPATFWGEGRELPPTDVSPASIGRLHLEAEKERRRTARALKNQEKKQKVPVVPPSPSEEMIQRMKSAESDIDRLFGVN